jgi:hypothetical protein
MMEDYYDLDDQIDCVRREINKRKEVYPRLVAAQKLSQHKAYQEVQLMRAVLVTLLWANDRDNFTLLFGDKPEEELESNADQAA